MKRARRTSADRAAPAFYSSIRHAGEWEEDRHTAAFLRPIVEGERRRLAASSSPTPSPAGRSPVLPPLHS